MTPDSIEKIINAVLYEGYLLYPYRRSALKNRHRWNFGVLFPESYSARAGETSTMQTECLVLGHDETAVTVELRFLHLYAAAPAAAAQSLRANREEGIEREMRAPEINLARLGNESRILSFHFGAGQPRGTDAPAASAMPVYGTLEIGAARVSDGVYRLRAQARNVTPFGDDKADRERALPYALIATHIVLHATAGEFVSLMDPPQEYAEAAAGCRNAGAWPVLVGEQGQREWMLASPIILYDYPRIAPESPVNFFDGTEIDELLSLRMLTLADEEKQELRDGDARARAILELSEALPEDYLLKLHGALRGMDK